MEKRNEFYLLAVVAIVAIVAIVVLIMGTTKTQTTNTNGLSAEDTAGQAYALGDAHCFLDPRSNSGTCCCFFEGYRNMICGMACGAMPASSG
ncbi:MAG: hypothetical protein ACP5NV_00590 [Candidatus Woesearchaeota archaeon]